MRLKITGSMADKALKKEMRAAADFFASRLLSEKVNKNIHVDLVLTKDLLKEDKVYGWCDWIDNNLRPRYFEIEMDADLSRITAIRTLAHEMAHVKQWVYEELKDYVHKDSHWCGRPIDPSTPYRQRPWEADAFRLQNKLASEWFALKRREKKLRSAVDK